MRANQADKTRIENISGGGYLWTILTGRSRHYYEFGDVQAGKIIKGEFIVTIGKRAIIATQVQNGRRMPIIVKRWSKVGESDAKENPKLQQDDAQFNVEWFVDSDRNNWSYYYSDAGHNLVNCRDNDNILIYEFRS